MPTRYLGAAQPYRGKLTRPKLRLLLGLAKRQTIEPRPQTVRALLKYGLISEVGPKRYALTETGRVAATRYEPRRRAA